jgi:alpha-galactosidase
VNSAIEEMAVNGSTLGDPTMIYRAIAHDPLTAAVLSLAEIKTMVNEMFAQNHEWLPQFKHWKV